MRIKLKLELDKSHRNILPLSNRYETSSWIYRTINRSDECFSKWLVNNGYVSSLGKASFKMYSFSDFVIPKNTYTLVNDRLIVNAHAIYLYISVYIEPEAITDLANLFKEQEGEIGDMLNTVKFKVSDVGIEPLSDIKNTHRYRCLSPIVLSKPVEQNGRKRKVYLTPQDLDYKESFINYIVEKADRKCVKVEPDDIELRKHEKHFSNLIRMGSGTKRETMVKGFKFYFDLTAPKAVHEIIASSGIGDMCYQGFGFVEIVD